MSDPIVAAFGDDSKQVSVADQIGKLAARFEETADQMAKAKDEDTARYQAIKEENAQIAKDLTELKAKHDADLRNAEVDDAIKMAAQWKAMLPNMRQPSMAGVIGGGSVKASTSKRGDFLYGVHEANSHILDNQQVGKALLAEYGERQEAWGKATLGLTDATGGWIIPNAIVDEFIAPAAVDNIYRGLMTVIPGVTAFAVDIPFRSAARTRAAIAAFGDTKENLGLAYNGYTATMYTLARIYDISNQFLRQSRGAAEADVMSELAAAFAQGESYYIRDGSGSSQPFGYTSALTNGPSAFRSTFNSPSDSTVAGSMAAAIATAAGALAGRGVKPTAAVMSATSYWNMLRQGSDSAGFWFATMENSPASINPGTLVSPFGLPVYADADADLEAVAATVDNLVVADWKAFKVYFGESYRVDSSDVAGSRWDTNLTGFRGEEEMGFDARPAVYAGYAQAITDIVP